MDGWKKVRRALLSVTDKTGLVDFAQKLAAQGVDINLMTVADHADLIGNGLVTSEQVIADDPDLVRAMDAAIAGHQLVNADWNRFSPTKAVNHSQ